MEKIIENEVDSLDIDEKRERLKKIEKKLETCHQKLSQKLTNLKKES
jgi:tetrahydromethanopterin S-methyltransferase subunit G